MNIIRVYNRNRKKIWFIIVVIASLIVLLQVINKIIGEAERRKLYDVENNTDKNMTASSNDQIQVNGYKSVITGKDITEKENEQIKNIKTFLENCNNGNAEDAYSMLTDECKELLYPSIDEFKIYYCGNFFNEPRASYEVENWFDSTYKVNIVGDMLAAGKKDESQYKQDYITAIKTGNDYKLNVNSYVKRMKINKEIEENKIKLKVNYKDVYMDYEKYDMTIKNDNGYNIFLDTKTNADSMYLEDKSGLKYPAITNEIEKKDLNFIAGEEKTLSIKYYCRYMSTKVIYKLNFSNVILNSDKYTSNEKGNKIKISINI